MSERDGYGCSLCLAKGKCKTKVLTYIIAFTKNKGNSMSFENWESYNLSNVARNLNLKPA